MRLRIFKEVKLRVPRKKLSLLLEAIVDAEVRTKDSCQVNLVFTTDRRMCALNKQFRNLNRPTDVLSFGLGEPSGADDTFGEVYISMPMAKRQAKRYRTTLTEELLRLSCHGLLHLVGYDHIRATDAKKMRAREDHFLECLRSK